MKALVTGGAGFVGSHLCEKLLNQGHSVVAYDNLILGKKENLKNCLQHPKFSFIKNDLCNDPGLSSVFKGCETVFHLAANSDISAGGKQPDIDLQNGFISTYRVLEAMRETGVKKIIFSSTSAIYGEAKTKPTPEGYGPLCPESLYGASKLAAEGFISAFVHNFGIQAWIFRFANIVGARVTHGVIFDFITRLKKNPETLNVLGNGTQRKSYLHIDDCIAGILFGYESATAKVNIFNLASSGTTDVKTIASEVIRNMELNSKIVFGAEDRGWVGDIPFTWLDGQELEKLGWRAKMDSNSAIKKSIGDILNAWSDS
jgi:UDP-glucose 4-epimerase